MSPSVLKNPFLQEIEPDLLRRKLTVLQTFGPAAAQNQPVAGPESIDRNFGNPDSDDTMIRTPGGRMLRFSGPTSFPVMAPAAATNATNLAAPVEPASNLRVPYAGPSRKVSQISQLNFLGPSADKQ